MMASIPNMRSTPLTVPAGKTPAGGEAAPGDFAAQLAPVPAPLEAVTPPVDLTVEPVAPPLLVPEEVKAEDSEQAPSAKAGPRKDEQEAPVPDAVVLPFLQCLPVPATPQPVATPAKVVPAPADAATAATAAPAKAPSEPRSTPHPAPTAKGRGKACEPKGGKAGQPAPGTEAAPEPVEAPEIEAAVKELLQRKQVLTRQVATAPKAPPAETARPETVPDLALPHGRARSQPRSAAPAAIRAAAPQPVAELPQTAPIVIMPQPEPVTAEKTVTVEGTRTTELAVERKLDLARDSQWLDRLARDIAQAGSSDTPLRFRLHPQTLGHLQVELQQGDHGTAVRLTVETEAARQILSDAQPRLAAEARAQGVRIAETHVDLSGSGRHAPGDQRRQDEASQTPLIRTARGAGPEVAAAARPTGRARLDRYA